MISGAGADVGKWRTIRQIVVRLIGVVHAEGGLFSGGGGGHGPHAGLVQGQGSQGIPPQHALQHTASQQHTSVVQGRLSGLGLGRDLGSAHAAAHAKPAARISCARTAFRP